MLILSSEQVKKAEAAADARGISFEKMMEKAGCGCADFILKKYPAAEKATVLIGKGKNGGDGFVIARRLCEAGKKVTVISLFDAPFDPLSEKNRGKLPPRVKAMTYHADGDMILQEIRSADILIDAVFGIGFRGELPAHVTPLFKEANAASAVKIAIDIPSGLSALQPPAGEIFQADVTLSMLALKREHVLAPFRRYCGETHVIPIGFSLGAPRGVLSMTTDEAASLLPERPSNANKGTFGKALIIAGSRRMPGAAVIATNGALNAGAGLVQLAFPDECIVSVMTKLTECVFLPMATAENGEFLADDLSELISALDKCSAAAIGCGLGTGNNSEETVLSVIRSAKSPLVIDADGINILASHKDVLKEAKAPILITPHPGEMARLLGTDPATVNAARESTALSFAVRHNVYVLLKGENTVVASPDGRLYINPTGCAALSRGGSGDLLTGIVTALLSQGASPFDALRLGAYLHGLAGDIAESRYSSYSATVERITGCLADAFLKISGSK